MKRIQRQRSKGWRMPAGAVYVGRPSPWGNPFPVNGDVAPWLAIALGERGDAAGRRAAAVLAYRAWMREEPLPIPTAAPDDGGGEFEYGDGRVRKVKDIVVGMGLLTLSKSPIRLGSKPDLAPLRGHDLVCWCPLDQPCHADVLLELNAEEPQP